MPTVNIDKKDLLNLIGKNLTDEVLKDRIAMIGTDLSSINKEIVVEVFPNRPDLLSVEGLARALSSFIGHKVGLRNYTVKKSNYKVNVDKKTSSLRQHVACAVVKNLKLDDNIIKSLMLIQEKLHTTHGRNRKKASIGIYDLDKINFPLTYTTKTSEYKFIALDETKPMTIKEILDKHSKGKEFSYLVKDFKEYPIWLDSKNNVLSIPPIINSEDTKVTKNTKNIFVDVTGIDEFTVEKTLNIILTSLADRKGQIFEVRAGNKVYPNLNPSKIKLDINYVNKRLGLSLTKSEVAKLLEKMGFSYLNGTVLVPCYRVDVMHEVDLIEDIAIAYGYENFEIKIPNVATIAKEDEFEAFKNKVANILTGFGLIETNTYNLSNENLENKNMLLNEKLIKIKNAVNVDYNVLRLNVLPSLLEVLKNNKQNEYPQNVYEIGTVFRPKEESSLAIALTNSKVTYTDIKQILDSLGLQLNVEFKIKQENIPSFIPGRSAKITLGAKEVGVIGEVHPEVLENFSLNYPVAALELNLNELFKLRKV